MWKAIFIESCLLSALIFGGFYIHSNIIKEEIGISEESIMELSAQQKLVHISGNSTSNKTNIHLSGNTTETTDGHISGLIQQYPTKKLQN